MNRISLEELDLAAWVKAGDTVTWGQAYAEPLPLTEALMSQRFSIGAFNVFLGISAHATCRPEHSDLVHFTSYCASGYNGALARAGCLEILPVHYSQLDMALQAEVVMVQVAPPDEHGRFSLSLAYEYLIPVLQRARVIIAEVNQQAPSLSSPFYLRADQISVAVETDRPISEPRKTVAGDVEQRIAQWIAPLIPDGAVLQTGIGSIPDSVMTALIHHKDLGVHTGSIGDGMVDLVRRGVITNSQKKFDSGKSVGGIFLGGESARRYADRNPQFSMHSSQHTHAASVLAQIDNFVSINSAIEVDLTGQVNSEVLGGHYVGAIGGSLDFHRGAQSAKNGVPIIALPSLSKGLSRIVPELQGPATIPRSDVGIIVTEYGCADLRGLSLHQRRKRLLAIAAPEQREYLAFEAQKVLA